MLRLCMMIAVIFTLSAAEYLTNWIQPNTGKLVGACSGFETHMTDQAFSSARKGDSGGFWSPCTHLKTYGMNTAPGLLRFVANTFKPKTSVEFGCGLGLLSDYIRRFAMTDAICIEPDKALTELLMQTASQSKGGSMTAIGANLLDDADQGARSCASSLMEKKFDVVLSFEVAEHVPFDKHRNFVELLARSTGKVLVFSAARLGQGGTGHLNESSFPKEHWVEAFTEAGLQHMPKLSTAARLSGYWGRSYDIYSNTIVMKNPLYELTDSLDLSGLSDFEWGGPAVEAQNFCKIDGTANCPADAFQIGTPANYERFVKFRENEESTLWPALHAQISDVQSGKRKCEVTSGSEM